MDGSAKYELLQRIAGEKIVAFRGRQTASGQIVLLHQLTVANDHTDVLNLAVQYLLRTPVSAGGRILDMVDVQGSRFLVTVDQPECLALREWLQWEMEGAKPAPAYAPQPPPTAYAPPPAAREPGEFTRLFQERSGSTARQPAAAQPAMPAPPPQPAAGPGEFTQLFGRGGRSQQSDPPPMATPRPAMTPALASEKQPGEFTQLFRSPLAAPAESPMNSLPTPSSARGPGEFTRIFGGSTPPSVSGPPPAVPQQSPPPPPASNPGFLTESLEPRHAQTNRPEAAPSSAPSMGEFTRVISRPSAGGAGPASTSAPAAPPAAAPAPSIAAPSFAPPIPAAPAAPPLPAAPTPPAMPAVAPPAAGGVQGHAAARPTVGLIILFVVLLLAAIALIVFVMLRH